MSFGLVLSDQAHADLGVSAYKGLHRREGALAALIKAGEDRLIQTPTVLLVESIDRLSREKTMDGLDTIKRLIRGGWVVVTCEDRNIYDEPAINGPLAHVIVAKLQQANGESQRKSDLLSSAWESKRRRAVENGEPLSSHCPGWLRRKHPDRPVDPALVDHSIDHPHYWVMRTQADIVRRIFKLAASGLHRDRIVHILNAEGVPPLGRSVEDRRGPAEMWQGSRVGVLLRDKRVLGYNKLCKRDGAGDREEIAVARTYPAIITPSEWQDARDVIGTRQTLTGRKGKDVANLFTRLAHCTCGASMIIRSGGRIRPNAKDPDARKRHYWNVLTCANSVEGRKCTHRTRYPLRVWERAMLHAMLVSPPKLQQSDAEIRALADRIAELSIEITENEQALGALAPKAHKPLIFKQIEAIEEETEKKLKRREELSIEYEARKDRDSGEVVETIERLMDDATVRRDVDAREKMRALLPQIVSRIVANAEPGVMRVTMKNGYEFPINAEGIVMFPPTQPEVDVETPKWLVEAMVPAE